jgi:hypothetical protein
VLSQGYCASCYAFASAAAIESAVAIAKKTTVSVTSPQPWVDCFWDFYGCGECLPHNSAGLQIPDLSFFRMQHQNASVLSAMWRCKN